MDEWRSFQGRRMSAALKECHVPKPHTNPHLRCPLHADVPLEGAVVNPAPPSSMGSRQLCHPSLPGLTHGDSACSWSHKQQLETQGDSAVSMETAHLQLNVINRCCNNLERWRKCFKPSVVYGGSVDVQICSVMTELHVNTHSGKHTDVCVCREKSLTWVKQEGVGDFFSVLRLCPWGGDLPIPFCPAVEWGSAAHQVMATASFVLWGGWL